MKTLARLLAHCLAIVLLAVLIGLGILRSLYELVVNLPSYLLALLVVRPLEVLVDYLMKE